MRGNLRSPKIEISLKFSGYRIWNSEVFSWTGSGTLCWLTRDSQLVLRWWGELEGCCRKRNLSKVIKLTYFTCTRLIKIKYMCVSTVLFVPLCSRLKLPFWFRIVVLQTPSIFFYQGLLIFYLVNNDVDDLHNRVASIKITRIGSLTLSDPP